MLNLLDQYSWIQDLYHLIFPIHLTSDPILLQQESFVPQMGFTQPKKQFLLIAAASPLLPLFLLPEKLFSSTLSSSFQVMCSKKPPLSVPAHSALSFL